jgi:hypothetical protein
MSSCLWYSVQCGTVVEFAFIFGISLHFGGTYCLFLQHSTLQIETAGFSKTFVSTTTQKNSYGGNIFYLYFLGAEFDSRLWHRLV